MINISVGTENVELIKRYRRKKSSDNKKVLKF